MSLFDDFELGPDGRIRRPRRRRGPSGPPLSVEIRPANTIIAPSVGTQQYQAIAHYPGGVELDVTADAAWSSSDPTLVTIDAQGLASAVAPVGAEIFGELSGLFSETGSTRGGGADRYADYYLVQSASGTTATFVVRGDGDVYFPTLSDETDPDTRLYYFFPYVGTTIDWPNTGNYGFAFNDDSDVVGAGTGYWSAIPNCDVIAGTQYVLEVTSYNERAEFTYRLTAHNPSDLSQLANVTLTKIPKPAGA